MAGGAAAGRGRPRRRGRHGHPPSWAAEADALAAALAADGVAAGSSISATGAVGRAWLTAAWAAAKLGAGLVGLPSGADRPPGAFAVADVCVPAGPALRRQSGSHPPPDSLVFSASGRGVRRSFPPAAVAAVGPVLADLVARTRAAPGTTLVACGPVADAVVTFQAGVVLVGGGRVVTAADPVAALALGAAEAASAAALSPGALAALAGLGGFAREALDVLAVDTVVAGGAPLEPDALAVAEDLFGPAALVDVYATAETGAIAVRTATDGHHLLLEGVEARLDAGGRLEVRSPLAANRGWVATGDRAALDDGTVRLLER